MGIDLGSRDAFMAQHFLNGTKVGAAFHEVGGKGMAESMGRDIFCDARLAGKLFQEEEDHYPGELCTPAIEKQDVLIARLKGDVNTDILLIDPDVFCCGAADGYKSFLVPFADDPDISYVKVKTGDAQINHLADAESAAI